MYNLAGQVALVTGAGGMRTVGRAVAERLASEGADLALTDIQRNPEDLPDDEVEAGWRGIESVADEVRKKGRRVLARHADLRSSRQVQELVQRVVEEFGRIDVLVNTHRAIIGRDQVPITELEEDDWQRTLDVNATSVFLTTKYVAREMIRLGVQGRIINIGSNASKQAHARGAAYASSKFALVGLTEGSALDLAPHGILVNAVCPGPIDTNRLNYRERREAQELDIPLEEHRRRVVEASARAIPLGRIATAEDVANMVAWLASPEASYITGQAFNVNGGLFFH